MADAQWYEEPEYDVLCVLADDAPPARYGFLQYFESDGTTRTEIVLLPPV